VIPGAWVIFSDNEMSWGDDTSIAVAALNSGPRQPAKQIFVADLQAKYGEISKLNAAWGAHFESWDGLLQKPRRPSGTSQGSDGFNRVLYKDRRAVFSHRARHDQSGRAAPTLSRLPVRLGQRTGRRGCRKIL